MARSRLATYTFLTKHADKGRDGCKIDKIFIHHMAGDFTVRHCDSIFMTSAASAHYAVNGKEIGCYVDEADTAWHCGNWDYNLRSIGIELANDKGSSGRWHVSDETIETAIRLTADICLRNGIKRLNYTGDLSGNLCMHCWLTETECPGPYLKSKFGYIASEVNKLLTPADI